MKTALIYDWIVALGGGERVLETISDIYPAPIYTLVRDPKLFADKDIRSSFLQKIPGATKYYRYFLPLFPRAIEQFDLRGYDLVISTSHAVAKGALTHSDQLHLCYCFTPMRYAWDLYHSYLESTGSIQRRAAKYFLHHLRAWDQASSNRVDHFASISHYIAKRIYKTYRRESTIIYPPVATHRFKPSDKKEDYYLTVSRLVPYKKIDLIVEAFSHMPDKKLVVIGDGPEMKKVKMKAKPNIEILGFQSEESVSKYLAEAKAFVFAAEEDFGIAPIEAQASGTPVIAFGKGGALETVVENESGVFFQEQTIGSIIESVNCFEKISAKFDPKKIQCLAARFSEDRFKKEFQGFVDLKMAEFQNSRFSRK